MCCCWQACIDHLSCGAGCGCNEVVNVYNYDCAMEMSPFSPALAGTYLNEYCPKSCDNCPGGGAAGEGQRFCIDNTAWSSDDGHTCSDYAEGGSQHEHCFDGPAFVACPYSCGDCGDYCT
eukprot:SAG11_NODE_14292_length_618_cov_0.693642_1_plen_119_part_01